jgi:hypothetical protein
MLFRLPQAQAQLERTPLLLRAWFGGLPDPWLRLNEGAETFSARDILAHLIHGERTDWMVRIRRLLEHGEDCPFEPFERDGFLTESRTWSVEALLDEFQSLRCENLRELASLGLSEGDLQRYGQHPLFGRVTLRELIAAWVVHDLDHLAQAARVMAKGYTSDVGPWINFMPILTMWKAQPDH